MAKWYEVYVAWWDDETLHWKLSAISCWQYLFARLVGHCASSDAIDRTEYSMYHVPRKNIQII